MAWKTIDEKKVSPRTKETLWDSSSSNTLETWTKDLAVGGFKLVGEYDLGNGSTLYRFEGEGPAHNVIIGSK